MALHAIFASGEMSGMAKKNNLSTSNEFNDVIISVIHVGQANPNLCK